MTVYAYANTMAVDIAGTRYVPAAGFADIGTTTSGSIGFGTWNSQARVWYDDATLRRFVVPEPAVALGAQQTWP